MAKKQYVTTPEKATKAARDCARDALLNLRACPFEKWTERMILADYALRAVAKELS